MTLEGIILSSTVDSRIEILLDILVSRDGES